MQKNVARSCCLFSEKIIFFHDIKKPTSDYQSLVGQEEVILIPPLSLIFCLEFGEE